MTHNLTRQSGILPSNRFIGKRVYLVGAGGIGSWTGLALSKMGISRLTIVDDDRVEAENVSSQAYMERNIGSLKVEALHETLHLFSPETRVTIVSHKFTGQPAPSGIVISAVDSMASRTAIWEAVKENAHRVEFYIEARMAIEFLWLFSFKPYDADQAAWYEKMLYPDSQVVPAPCTQRAIVYTAFTAASQIARVVKLHLSDQFVPRQIKYDIANDILKVSKDASILLA